MLTHYDVLGIAPAATPDELKSAYRRLAMRLHPDRHAQDPPAERAQREAALRRLNEAYRVLRDADRRRAYDATLRPKPSAGTPLTFIPGTNVRKPPPLWGFRSVPHEDDDEESDGLHLWATGATDLSPLGQIQPGRIHCLQAGQPWVDDRQLPHIEHLALERLDLPGAPVTNAGLRSVARLTTLRRLSLDQTDVTDAGMAALLALHDLSTLNLRRTRVSSEGVRVLLDLPNLHTVWVPWHIGHRTRRTLRQHRPDLVLV